MMLLSLITAASAAEFTMDASVAASYWPLGLRFAANPGAKFPLWNQEDSTLFADTYLQVSCLCVVTPAYGRVGPRVTFSPIAVLDLSADYVVSSYFGTFTAVIGFDDPDIVYTPEVLEAEADAGNRGTGFATRWGTAATLKAKAGPIIVAANGRLQGWNITAADNVVGAYIYEPELDLIISRKDTSLNTTSVLMYEMTPSEEVTLRIGAMDSYSNARSTDATIHRLGPMATLATAGGTWNYLLLLQAQLNHRVEETLPPYTAFRVQWKK